MSLTSAIKSALECRAKAVSPELVEVEIRLGVRRDQHSFVPSLDGFLWSALFESLYERALVVSPLRRDQVQLFAGAEDSRGARFIVDSGW